MYNYRVLIDIMDKGKRKITTYLLIVGFLLSTFFACVSMAQNFSVSHEGHLATMLGCCDGASVLGSTSHNVPSILGTSTGLQLLLLSLAAAYLFSKSNYLISSYTLRDYFKRYNQAYSFKLFSYLIHLFSQGVLHPKIY